MVLGEPQILAQVKQAYQVATEQDNTGPLMHAVFQAALRVARRVASETTIHQRRVSVPSVAVADFARQIFERFDDKETLVIGAGEMAEETLRYLQEEGVRQITVVNRHFHRAEELAGRWRARPWPGKNCCRRWRPPIWSSAPRAPASRSSRQAQFAAVKPRAPSGRC